MLSQPLAVDAMLTLLTPCVIKLPVPLRELLPVTSKAPCTVTVPVPPKAPPLMVSVGKTIAPVVLKPKPPPLMVTGAKVPEMALPLTLSPPPLTFRAAPVLPMLSRLLALTVAP